MRKISLNKKGGKFPFSGRAKIYFWALALTFVAVNVFFAIQTATTGSELASYEEKGRVLESQNQDLLDSLVRKTSLSGLTQKATASGFLTPTVVYLRPESVFADLGQSR